MNDNLKQIEISKIFNDDTYIIPIYQRNYAWGEKEIHQLLDDIISAEGNYYLGTLIVNKKDNNTYEVIDGQQRLTTLYLLGIFLNKNINENSLKFEAREKYQKTLSTLIRNYPETNSNDFYADELYSGLKLIDRYFNEKKIDINNFINKLDTTYLIRINVPENIDLNHYFEIMNTRGEQLELHELAKSKFLNVFNNDIESQNTVSLIWDCCYDMNSYVQMNFPYKIRNRLFTDDWSNLKENINFEEIKEIINNESQNKSEYSQDPKDKQTLSEILKGNNKIPNENKKNDEENERFESVLSFPNFLLQVNAVNSEDEEESSLDDKKFLNKLEDNWQDEEKAKDFIIKMLKCRVLYDKYIIKREYTSKYINGRWALQELYKYDNKPQYRASLREAEGKEEQINNNQLKTLEACLRITYTSPKTMHWIKLKRI